MAGKKIETIVSILVFISLMLMGLKYFKEEQRKIKRYEKDIRLNGRPANTWNNNGCK